MKKLSLVFFLLIPFFHHAQDLNIYSLRSNHEEGQELKGFVSLTHSYQWSENPDLAIIAEEYLGHISTVKRNYHKLTDNLRTRFFEKIDIRETYLLTIFSYDRDTLITLKVKDLPLVAQHSGYGMQNVPLRPNDYMIGFEIDGNVIQTLGNSYHYSLISVQENNPFLPNNLQPVIWEKVDSEEFPSSLESVENGETFSELVHGDTYYFKNSDYEYFLQKLHKKSFLVQHLAVVDAQSNKIIFERLFPEGEDASHTPLATKKRTYEGRVFQWTGKLFQKKPPVILGFQRHRFRCPVIDFLSKSDPPIRIKCDNRH